MSEAEEVAGAPPAPAGTPAEPSTPATPADGTLMSAPPPRKPPRRGPKVMVERPKRAIFCMTLKNPLRKLCIDIVEWKNTMANKIYLIVKFLLDHEGEEYFIVPKSWLWLNSNGEAAVAYPEELPVLTRKRVKNYERSSREWKIFRVSIKYWTDSYEEASQAIQDLKNNSNNNASGNSIEDDSLDFHDLFKNMAISKPDGLNKSSNNLNTSPSKPKTTQDNERKEDNDAEDKYKSPKRILQKPFKKTSNQNLYDSKNTLKYINLVELAPESNVYIDADKLEECKAAENHSEMILSLMNATFTDKTQAKRLLTAPVDPKTASTHFEKALEAISKFADENNKWPNSSKEKLEIPTRYPCLSKLMPDSYVLATPRDVADAVSFSYGSHTRLARKLMEAVFTEEALKTCSLRGEDAMAFGRANADSRPGLDETAVEVILKFVENKFTDKPFNRQTVLKAMSNDLYRRRS